MGISKPDESDQGALPVGPEQDDNPASGSSDRWEAGSDCDTVDGLTMVGESERQKTVGTLYLIALTLTAGGLQVVWSVILSNGSPYLSSLGLSESLTALVWVASPLAGMLVQPCIGILSDRSRNPWGKRRPYMAGGAAATVMCMLSLAWTPNFVRWMVYASNSAIPEKTIQTVIIMLAVVWVYALNIAIQPVQSGIRAFIIDNCPAHQQVEANAWASRATGIGNVLGYLSGSTNLRESVSFLDIAQFKALCIIASLALGITMTVSCICIQEKDPRQDGPRPTTTSLVGIFKEVYRSLRTLPPVTRKVCRTQFFSWLGWFPFLFYVTTYIGEFYTKPIYNNHHNLTPATQAAIDDHATRHGTFAFLIFALVALAANLVLPFLMQLSTREAVLAEKYPSGAPFRTHLAIPGLTLERAWCGSHILFAACMAGTFLVSSAVGSTLLVGLSGVSWAVTLWVPFALISEEVAVCQIQRRHHGSEETEPAGQDQAGAVTGLHNMAIAAPQIIAALFCAGLFRILQTACVENTTVWALRAGGLSALVAARLAVGVSEG